MSSCCRVVAVLGANGFVGTSVREAAERRGAEVRAVSAPRLSTSARDESDLREELGRHSAQIDALRRSLEDVDVIVNAAGVADPTSPDLDDLFGANALLPAVVVSAAAGRRVVHVSSAAVQGRCSRLDESTNTAPFSPYSVSKALGERLVVGHPNLIVFRPSSVQGPGRAVTSSLVRFLSSRLASVAGRGDRSTPQVQVANVGDAVAFVALTDQTPPAVILQPGEGLTTGELVRLLGGREPVHVPLPVARIAVSIADRAGRRSARVAGVGRRLEMLWFGQDQVLGWLTTTDWKPVVGRESWEEVR
jgi:nucleoside-diphosphate-sugar epimerase